MVKQHKGHVVSTSVVQIPRSLKNKPDAPDTIARALRGGVYFSTACEYAGVQYRTALGWVSKGRDIATRYEQEPWELSPAESVLMELALEVDKAQAEVEVQAITRVQKAGQTDWRAAAWLLEHRFRDRWSERKEVHHTGGVEVDVVNKRQAADEALAELHKRLTALESGEDNVIEAEVVND